MIPWAPPCGLAEQRSLNPSTTRRFALKTSLRITSGLPFNFQVFIREIIFCWNPKCLELFSCQDRSVGWNIFTPAYLCHKLRLISVTPCLPKPRDSSKAVPRAPSGKDAEGSVCVCSRERAMVSLWMEREVKTHLPPSEIPDRQAGRRWGRVELEIHWARLSV